MKPEIASTSFVTSDGVRLHVLEAHPHGREAARAAEPVIAFVPGWSMPADIWRAQLEVLGSEYCVAALDPRGQGRSDLPAHGYTIARRARDVGEYIARYPGVVLVGWSLGALEALEYLHLHGPAGIEALVLVDASVGEDPAPPSAGRFVEALRRDRRAALDDFIRASFHTPQPEASIAALIEGALRLSLEESLSLFPRTTPREHWRSIARAFPRPLLYSVTTRYAEQAQSLQRNRPGTRVELFEQAGHALFVDEPDRFNAALARFVREAVGGGRVTTG